MLDPDQLAKTLLVLVAIYVVVTLWARVVTRWMGA